MPETRIWHPYQGANPIFCNVPVVALRLPPANFSNRFAVKHTNHYYVHNITNLVVLLIRIETVDSSNESHSEDRSHTNVFRFTR